MKRISIACGVLCMLLFASCHEEAPISPTSHLEEQHFKLYRASIADPFKILDEVSIDLSKIEYDTAVDYRSPDASANGHFVTQMGHVTTFSAVRIGESVFGHGNVTGPIYIDVKWDTDCIEVVGNKATIGGLITSLEIIELPPDQPMPEVGWYFYLAVQDMGEGKKADPDRYHQFVYLGAPGLGSFCDVLSPINPIAWPEDLWLDVAGKGDQIQVK